MRLLSIAVSPPRKVSYRGRDLSTGIFKQPVTGRVMLRRLNLDGDGQADLDNHGGPSKAAYAYPVEHYPHWERELGRTDFAHGQFGENFTVEGMLEDAVRIGGVFRVGGALVQVSQPRIPCYKLALRLRQDAGFPKRFLASRRVGFYLRVLEEGEVGAGDAIEPVRHDPGALSVTEAVDLMYGGGDDDGMRRALRIDGLSDEWRRAFEARLAEMGVPAAADDPAPGPAMEPAAAAGLPVTFAASGLTVPWDPAFDSLLEFAEAQGLSPDHSCRSGYCHTCMCPLVEGEVHYAEEPPLAPDPGHVLICCSTPRTGVTIDV